MTVHEFSLDRIAADPEKGAEQMQRLFGGDVDEAALRQAQHFIAIDAMDQPHFWLEVRAHLREMELRGRMGTVH
ncbi:hypothetical protein AA101099_0759 [Neoasaia chiangmaiensis NBRC 101099]|uniref:Uncharacterized protein n=1 Tax=Neoasaia chiangmaiensis TaxID=320497 RepID=A0A1U9KM83_9PROT|nr:hypothetical protein [Neoasaia chiangmaiensis]AQS86899.1 hypothetical protein A0U93_01865 [Neoasaia chiangmaiensis]GBR37521.1 hypothetical protein AA101099_0759 [Neoasaia chiangmaiensis NBRC 101099]